MNVTNVQAGPNANVTASLEDNGDLRLINEIDKMVLWQIFDHRTDVLLPGIFTLGWEPIDESSPRFVIRQRDQLYWTSGNLTNESFETGIEGLAECKASASNLSRIQVKDIVKEIEDYLKTYSSAGMDISWYVEGIRCGFKESQRWQYSDYSVTL
ncbi:G-type lectin S-receptor-like serine/threonine-protein kinase [Tanacetum coccineum]